MVFDNYDSFTYNLVHGVRSLGYTDLEVRRNDRIALEEVARFDKIILSPGPGIPSEAGLLEPLVRAYAPTKSILGVCLGEQAIGECFGARLRNLAQVFHGVATPVEVVAPDPLFEGLGARFEAGRYHSWVVDETGFPGELTVTARDGAGEIMALAHRRYDVRGVQFHPESVLTPLGAKMLENWLKA